MCTMCFFLSFCLLFSTPPPHKKKTSPPLLSLFLLMQYILHLTIQQKHALYLSVHSIIFLLLWPQPTKTAYPSTPDEHCMSNKEDNKVSESSSMGGDPGILEDDKMVQVKYILFIFFFILYIYMF